MADDLPLRIVIVNQNEVDAQLERITRDRTVGGGGGRARPTGQVGSAAQQGASAGDAAKTGLVTGLTTAAVQGLKDSIRSLSSGLATAFDPTLTTAQREAGAIGEGLAAIPVVGQAASQIFRNVVAPQLAVQEQASSRLNSQFNSLFEAVGIGLGIKATPSSVKKELLERFGGAGGLLERIGQFETSRAAGAVGGQLAVAEVIGKEGVDFEAAGRQALTEATNLVDRLLPSAKEVADALDNLAAALKDPLLALRSGVLPGLGEGLGNPGND